MEGSYCEKTGTSTEVTLSLNQTGVNCLKIAGGRACRHVFAGQRHKGMSEPRRGGAPSLPRTAGPGQAAGRHGSAAQLALIPPQQHLLTLITSFLGVRGFLPPGGAAACSSQRAHGSSPGGAGERGPGRARTITTKYTISTPLYLSVEVTGGMSSMQPCGSRRCRCREAQPRGDTPAPQGPPGRARCPARPELRGAHGLLGSAKGSEDGRAASPLPRTACGPTAGLLPAGLLLPVQLLPTRLLPLTRPTVTCRPCSLPPAPCPPDGGRRYLSGRAASPARMDRAAQWQPNKTPPATPPPPPARAHWPYVPPAEP